MSDGQITAYYKTYEQAAERLRISVAELEELVEAGEIIPEYWQRQFWITAYEISRYEKLSEEN